jgi:hypothetical protein
MFIKLAFVLVLAMTAQAASNTYEEPLKAASFNITDYIVGVVYGFFDSIDYFEAWNCSQGIVTFYNNVTRAILSVQKNSGGLQGTINFLNVIITILNCTINELTYCGKVIDELMTVGKTFYYMFVSPHYIEDLGENFVKCSPFFLYYYEQMVRQMNTNSTACGYYTMLGIFDTVLLTTYSRQIGSTADNNCDLEGFKHSVWSPT